MRTILSLRFPQEESDVPLTVYPDRKKNPAPSILKSTILLWFHIAYVLIDEKTETTVRRVDTPDTLTHVSAQETLAR